MNPTNHPKNLPCLYTVGYEGIDVEVLINKLINEGIEILLDVREVTASRKAGFSKKQLSESIQQNGMRYKHFRDLGSPSDVRHELRRTGDFVEFYEKYMEHLSKHKDILEQIDGIIKNQKCCLLCYERKPDMCHRKIVANELKKMENGKLEVIHL